MLFGGLRYNRNTNNVSRSTDLFVLDFSEPTPRWRKAAVDNINTQGAYQLAFPNTGIVPLSEIGTVALMHRAVSRRVRSRHRPVPGYVNTDCLPAYVVLGTAIVNKSE